jgi:hypothetical protein
LLRVPQLVIMTAGLPSPKAHADYAKPRIKPGKNPNRLGVCFVLHFVGVREP